MCNLFIQIYNEKTPEKQSENTKPVSTTKLSNIISEHPHVFCTDNLIEV